MINYLVSINLQQKYLMLKYLLLALAAGISYLLLASNKYGQPTKMPWFELKQELKDIPSIDLDRLKNAEFINLPQNFVEDVAVDKHGNIYAIAGAGPSYIYRIDGKNTSIQTKLGVTGGRVLGTALDKRQNLLAFIDEVEGLKLIDLHSLNIVTLATQYKGQKFTALNSVTFSPDNRYIYFTQSCQFSMQEYHLQILYKTGKGQLFELNLQTKQLKVIVDGLHFANGIVYDQKENCLYVVEINLYRIIRVQLSEGSKGKTSVVIEGLIGYPDNIKLTEDGMIWVAIPSLRDQGNVMVDNYPLIRKALINANVPEKLFLYVANLSYAGGLKVNPKTGKVVDYLFGKNNNFDFVTGVTERHKKVYLASLKHNKIAVVDYL